MSLTGCKLISYIAPGAPATRRPATGDELYLRPEIGFTPKWYHDALGIDFGKRWHTNPDYRLETVVAMRDDLQRRFPGYGIGDMSNRQPAMDLLTGAFGGCVVAGIYGVPIIYEIRAGSEPTMAVTWRDGKEQTLPTPAMNESRSSELFRRSGRIQKISIYVDADHLFKH